MTQTLTPSMPDSAAVRRYLTDALRIDLIGPRPGPEDATLQHERLEQGPSRWYLTGFLVPSNAPAEQRAQDAEEEFDAPAEPYHGGDDSNIPDRGSSKRNFFPSSIGLSILVDDDTDGLGIEVSWGDYSPESSESQETSADGAEIGDSQRGGGLRQRIRSWVRTPWAERVDISLSAVPEGELVSYPIPHSNGLEIVCLSRPTTVRTFSGNLNVRAISLFAVNRRTPQDDRNLEDAAFAFQVELTVEADHPLVSHPNPRGFETEDWDQLLADLHYSDVTEYATGYNVSAKAELIDSKCYRVRTEWMPQATVERTESAEISGVEFGMEALGSLADAATAERLLSPLVTQYREWINEQPAGSPWASGECSFTEFDWPAR